MQYLRFLTTVILILSIQITEAAIPESERNILLTVSEYAHPLLQDPGWTGSPGVECAWYGVTCDDNEEHIVKLSLMSEIDEEIKARIKQDVAQLPALQSLDFNNPQLPDLNHAQPAHIPERERNALLAIIKFADTKFQNAWSGPAGTECSWRGVTCSRNNEYVQSLDLESFGLTELASEINQLPELYRLDLGFNQLSGLPSELGQLNKITYLDLESNLLTTLPAEIGQLWQLFIFNLQANQLTSLPPEIGHLIRLYRLNLKSNQLVTLPAEIRGLKALRYFNLDANYLKTLSPEIGQLAGLFELTLHDNRLTTLPPEISQLKKLFSLDLSANQLVKLPSEIGGLTFLRELHLHSNLLTNLPSEIGQLSSLLSLSLHTNQLISLPSEIGQLTDLPELDLHFNQLIGLPSEISQLTKIRTLDLSDNQLTKFPVEIIQLTQLNRLDLSKNQLTGLPSDIKSLLDLKILRLNHNQLASFPMETLRLNALSELHLASNYLITLPADIERLSHFNDLDLVFPAFEYLDLSNNQLTDLPPEIGQLTDLKYLSLAHNQLTTLPSGFMQLSALKQLNLSSNKLIEIAPEISQLTALRELNLASNQLTEIPSTIGKLTRLMFFDISDNLLVTLPESIMNIEGEISCFTGCIIDNSLFIQNNCFSPSTLSTKIIDWMDSGLVFVNGEANSFGTEHQSNPELLKDQKDICAHPSSLSADTTLHYPDSDFIDFINTEQESRHAEQENPIAYTIYSAGAANYSSDILTTGVVPQNNLPARRIDTLGIENGDYEIIFWTENNTFMTGIQAWHRSFTKVSNEFNLANGDNLSSFFAVNNEPHFPQLSPALNLNYPLFFANPTLFEQIQQIPGFTSLQYEARQLSLAVSNYLYSIRPFKIEKSSEGEALGYQLSDNGLISITTSNQRTITAAPAIVNLEAFNSTLNNLNLSLLEIKQDGILKITASKPNQEITYFTAKANLVSKSVVINQTGPGLYFDPVPGLSNVLRAYHVFYNGEGQLMQQAIPSTPNDWGEFTKELERLGFTATSVDSDGIISTQKDNVLYHAFMSYRVNLKRFPSNVKTGFIPVGDLNADGYQDFRIMLKNLTENNSLYWEQILYLFPRE